MNALYKWMMTIGDNTYEVHPVYKDDLSLDYERETGQQFFRAKLSTKITLVGADADLILLAPFTTEFLITIKKSADYGISWNDYYTCHFYKTDCTINEHDKKISVQPSAKDRYNDILNGLDKEFDLLQLAPVIQSVQACKRPMFQIYTLGENIVTCYCSGNSFEQDVSDTSEQAAYRCHFSDLSDNWEFNISTSLEGFSTPFTGTNKGYGHTSYFFNEDDLYWIETYVTDYRQICQVFRRSDSELCWLYNEGVQGGTIPAQFTLEHQIDGLPDLTANKADVKIVTRMVLDKVTEYPLTSDDIVADNRNYRYCSPGGNMVVKQSVRLSESPTKWGKSMSGMYFLPPNDTDMWYPVGRSLWVNASVWMKETAADVQRELNGRKDFVIKDTFPLWSVINVLLEQVAPNISHGNTANYSQYLYGTQSPFGNEEYNNMTFITPKSNILSAEYQEPAKKAPITLKSIFEMLKNAFGCYWYIDADNRLVIEHLKWFKNGGSYSQQPTVGFDLTELVNLPNGKPWAFAASEYQYDKEDMPARYQYEWMDEVTAMFKGDAINVLSTFVKEDKVEEVNISSFTSDIDFMLLAPERCSKDGFALLQAQYDDGVWSIPFESYTFGVYEYNLQNYMMSMVFLQTNCLIYDMPSWDIELQGEQTTSLGIKRNKKQTLSFPAGENDPDLQKLVKTNIGNGQYDKVAINLSSRTAKVTLKYNTYDQ